jgi:ferric-dicitrate binding protein FerR (iron transport regulator)
MAALGKIVVRYHSVTESGACLGREQKAAVVYEREQKGRDRERAREEAARQKEREHRQQAVDKAQSALDKAEREPPASRPAANRRRPPGRPTRRASSESLGAANAGAMAPALSACG